jgi:cAMP-dependent protein kinase regulator
LAQVPLLSNIDTESRLRLAGLVGEKSFFEGEPIMRQGEKGDFMYVISEGSATVSSRAGQELARLKRGQYFGEQALLHSAPRNATVTASSLFQRAESIGQVACKCLRLSRDDFQRFVGGDLDRPEARAELLLAQVPLMSGLPLTRRKALAAAMVSRTFRDGDTIIEQGDEGDTMYVIENGRAEIHVVGVGVVAVNGRGQYFGETALLRHSKRTATVKAKGTCCCLELGQQNFNELAMDVIGPIARIELWLAHIPLLANLEPAAVRLPAFVQMALVLTPTA